MQIRKLYAIDTVQESYSLDGYLTAVWNDPTVSYADGVYFENDNVADVLGPQIWSPSIEFINTLEARDNPHVTLKFGKFNTVDNVLVGNVEYSERFHGAFSSADLDFRRYPFDEQTFTLVLESFANDSEKMKLAVWPDKTLEDGTYCHKNDSIPVIKELQDAMVEWELLEICQSIEVFELESVKYSSFTYAIKAERSPEYFIWQFFLPLLLIVASSWLVFFLRDFGDRLSIGFTLMLTVVAFNFFTSTLLPRLPYNTFIETAVISGYISIFGAILAVVLCHAAEKTRYQAVMSTFFSHCRWMFPFGYGLAALVGVYEFLYKPLE